MEQNSLIKGVDVGGVEEGVVQGVAPRRRNVFYRVWCFYRDGFREMTLGRTLWALILIKLFIMFVVLRLFFFPRALGGLTDEQKTDKVLDNLTETRGVAD